MLNLISSPLSIDVKINDISKLLEPYLLNKDDKIDLKNFPILSDKNFFLLSLFLLIKSLFILFSIFISILFFISFSISFSIPFNASLIKSFIKNLISGSIYLFEIKFFSSKRERLQKKIFLFPYFLI